VAASTLPIRQNIEQEIYERYRDAKGKNWEAAFIAVAMVSLCSPHPARASLRARRAGVGMLRGMCATVVAPLITPRGATTVAHIHLSTPTPARLARKLARAGCGLHRETIATAMKAILRFFPVSRRRKEGEDWGCEK